MKQDEERVRALIEPPATKAPSREDNPFSQIMTASPRMEIRIGIARRVAAASCPVLLLGETGTGKELFARAIHDSDRSGLPFVPLNCAAVAPTLLESELFGHAAGAFTGAGRAKRGLLEQAAAGTMLLDEIDKATPEFQAKLLRFLDTGEILRVGETTPRPARARIISAMNRDPSEQIREGALLPDLLYRLQGIRITLPPLRDRGGDALLLADHFLHVSCRASGRLLRLSPDSIDLLARYQWPGNVRELKSHIERAVLLAENGLITPESLGLEEPTARTGGRGDRVGRSISPSAEAERSVILEALHDAGGNVTHAARKLGIARSSLYRKIHKLGLSL